MLYCGVVLTNNFHTNGTENMNSWESLFLGRTEELGRLQKCWELAQKGQPQIAVLLGETGLGKTRIVQEFYAQITKGQNYWPSKLNTGQNLELQPKIDTGKLEDKNIKMPWLWWALRFGEQSSRNYLETTSPFEKEDANLAANGAVILRQREVNKTLMSGVKKLSDLALDLSGLGNVSHLLAAKELFDEITNLGKKTDTEKQENDESKNDDKFLKRFLKNASDDIEETLHNLKATIDNSLPTYHETKTDSELENVKKLAEKTISTLRHFLNKKVSDTPTVPVIIVIDDAQWIDPISVTALYLVFKDAQRNNFPLMVLATHWQKEWNEVNTNIHPKDFNKFRHMYEYVKAINNHSEEQYSVHTSIELKSMPDLMPIAQQALPGVSHEIHEKLNTESDGNPRAMEEMLRNLIDFPESYFENGDPNQALNEDGLDEVAQLMGTELYNKIEKRFKKLEADTRDLLATSSIFGIRFLSPIIADILNRYKENEDFVDTNYLLMEAEKIHVLIQKVTDCGHTFQQKVYREVSHDYLKRLKSKYRKIYELKNEILTRWLSGEQLAKLSLDEQIQLCEFALNDYINSDKAFDEQEIISRAYAFEHLIAILEGKGEESKIAQWWSLIATNLDEVGYLFFYKLRHSIDKITLVIKYNAKRKDEVIDIAEKVIEQLQKGELDNNERLQKWFYTLANILNIYSGRTDEAKVLCNKSVNVLEDILEYDGEEIERLQNLSESFLLLGIIESKIANYENAQICYERALSVNQRAFSCAPNDLKLFWTKARISDKYGDLYLTKNKDSKKAREKFTNSLIILNYLLKESTSKPEILNLLIELLSKLGQIAKLLGRDYELAKLYYDDALIAVQRLQDINGDTPDSLNTRSLVFFHFGDTAFRQKDYKTSKDFYEKALSTGLESLEYFGQNFTQLKRARLAAGRLGFMATEWEENYDNAAHYFGLARHYKDLIKDNFDRDAGAIQGIANLVSD